MNNIVSYAREVVSTFEELPFSNVDSLILSWLAYFRYPKISKVTYGNLSLLLRDLKNLERTYRIMLENENVTFTMNGEYCTKIAQINEKKNSDNNN